MSRNVLKNIALSVFSVAFVLAGGVFWLKSASAATTGSVYLVTSPTSVQNGGSVTVSIRINPGTTVDSVQGTLNFDASKLTYQSVNTAASAFSTELQNSQSGSTVTFGRGDFGSGVSSDALVETVTFTAKVGSGSTTLSLTGANADSSGTFTNPATSGATITFTTPPATCPAGQTGTPPNCITPPAGGGGTGTGGGSGSGSGTAGGTGPTSGAKSGGSGSNGSSSAGGSTNGSGQPTQTPANGKPPVIANTDIQYTQAHLSFTTATPTQLYVRFGINGQLTIDTPVSGYATTHTITIDPSLLTPGETYSYIAVSTDASGNVVQSAVQTFTTKGLQVKVGVYDRNHKPLKNKQVTIHSTPQTVTTDANGIATFANMTPGQHQVMYSAGGKTYKQAVTVRNNVQSSGAQQSAPVQNFSVVYALTQSEVSPAVLVWLLLIVIVVGTLGILAATGRLGFALQMRKQPQVPLVSQPIIVGGATTPVQDVVDPSPNDTAASEPALDERLSALPNPDKPTPGSTVAPQAANEAAEKDQSE